MVRLRGLARGVVRRPRPPRPFRRPEDRIGVADRVGHGLLEGGLQYLQVRDQPPAKRHHASAPGLGVLGAKEQRLPSQIRVRPACSEGCR